MIADKATIGTLAKSIIGNSNVILEAVRFDCYGVDIDCKFSRGCGGDKTGITVNYTIENVAIDADLELEFKTIKKVNEAISKALKDVQ